MIDRVERVEGHAARSTSSARRRRSTSQMVFAVAEEAGWLQPPARAVHVAFGNVLGTDRKMLQSRSGEPVKLIELLDEARRAGRARGGREEPRPAAGRAGRGRPSRRHRGGQVRRPLDRSHQGLRLRLGPHAGVRRQHRRPTCSTPTPASARSSAAPGSTAPASRPSPRPSTRRRSGRWRSPSSAFDGGRARDARALGSPHRLCTYLFELRQHLHGVLRGLPGAAAPRSRCAPAGWRWPTSRPACWPPGSGCSASRRRSGCEPGTPVADASLLPDVTASEAAPRPLLRRPEGQLLIAGVDVAELAAEHGTPLFVYDEDHLRARCREAVEAFGDGNVVYATKAFLCRAMARLAHEEGLLLDVATGGELHVALAAGVPADRLVVHGNNKCDGRAADGARPPASACIVVDSFDELDRLDALHAEGLPAPAVQLRITPGRRGPHPRVRRAPARTTPSSASACAQRRRAAAPSSACAGLAGGRAGGRSTAHIGSQVFARRELRPGGRGDGRLRPPATACPS